MSTNGRFLSIDSSKAYPIGSLWRRILAFVVDGLILYAVGRAVGAALFDTLSRIGPWGRLVGFCLTLVYFATMESRIGGGQTFGKRLLRLRVVNAQGSLISWERSAVRYTICAIPYFFIGSKYSVQIMNWVILTLIIFTVFGIGVSNLYLLIFNSRTRQGLHDVAVGTFVVKPGVAGPLNPEPIWNLHWWVIICFLFMIALTALSKGISVDWQQKSGYVSQHLQDERLIEKLGGVQMADVLIWSPIRSDSGTRGNFLPKKEPATVIVQWTGKIEAREAFADQVARVILQNDPHVQKQELIRIEIGRSYDLGIASGNDLSIFIHTPIEWSQRVQGISGAGPHN